MLKIFGGGTCQKLVKNRIFHKKQCFLRDMSFLELHYWSTNYSLFIIHGKEVHLYTVILNPIVFTEWIYGMAYRGAKFEEFVRKKNRIFLLESTQNLLKRTVNQFLTYFKNFALTRISGWDLEIFWTFLKNRKIMIFYQKPMNWLNLTRDCVYVSA